MASLEDTYGVGHNFVSFLHLANSNRVSSQSLANHEAVAQTPFANIPLLGCPDTTRPDDLGLSSKVEYVNASRTPEDVAIEDLGEMLVGFLNILNPHTMLYDPINNHCELDRHNGPSKEERCERLMKLDTMIHKVRAALISLRRQLGQLLISRHKHLAAELER